MCTKCLDMCPSQLVSSKETVQGVNYVVTTFWSSNRKYETIALIVLSLEMLFQSEYAFEVFELDKCQLSKEGWAISAARLNCNSSHWYHCVPNKQLTSLIEFCYPKGHRFPFEKGILIHFVIS